MGEGLGMGNLEGQRHLEEKLGKGIRKKENS